MDEAERQRQRIAELEKRLAEIEEDYERFKQKYLSRFRTDNDLFQSFKNRTDLHWDNLLTLWSAMLRHEEFLFPEKKAELRQQFVALMSREDKPI